MLKMPIMRVRTFLKDKWKDKWLVVAPLIALGVLVFGVVIYNILPDSDDAIEPLPDFKSYTDVKEKKAAFFQYIFALVDRRNKEIADTRKQLLALGDKVPDDLSKKEEQFIVKLSDRYDITNPESLTIENYDALLARVDIVPPSLALAQAAKESGWGTSRFSVEANNLFGQWCFTEGCGLVPSSRNAGAVHEVRKFDSVGQAVNSYMHNLNTGFAYEDLRSMREKLRDTESVIHGADLAEGLLRYSERGAPYVEEIKSMIRTNNLSELDTVYMEE